MSTSVRSPQAVAMRRIQSEMRDWLLHPPEGCSLDGYEPLTTWVVRVEGPETPEGAPKMYEGQTFKLQIKFPERYPLEPPEVVFLAPSPLHPHVYSNGHICLDILYDGRNGAWSPALTINKVVLSIRSMLASNTDARRPAGDQDYCSRSRGRSPKDTKWNFDDDRV